MLALKSGSKSPSSWCKCYGGYRAELIFFYQNGQEEIVVPVGCAWMKKDTDGQ